MTRYTSHTIYTSHTRYTRSYMCEPHHLHKPYRIHKPHHRKRVPGRHFIALYFPIEKGSPEDTLSHFTPHRKRVPGRHFDMVYRHTVKMEKQGDTMRQKEQFYCVS